MVFIKRNFSIFWSLDVELGRISSGKATDCGIRCNL